ncbi:LAFA_0G24630g1_1 [Lachancea sp. 'fantastica']|nr:LAFA_0A00188g1_1 [Lachancea sp. 'fantastica']SCU99531.1 LAFA_0G24630g1_1 [Lachancea sp. 'fantastica']
MKRSMPSVPTVMLHGRRYRRLCLLVLFLLSLLTLSSFLQAWRSSELSKIVINSLLESQREESLTGLRFAEKKCSEYFRTLSSLDNEWETRSFGDAHTPLFSRRHVLESVRHMRVFGQCFIQNSSPYGDLNIRKIEDRLFPTFTGILPTFRRWDGLTIEGFPAADGVLNSGPPISSDFSFWKQVKGKMKGRGLVISVSDSCVSDAKRLLRVLRALHNELPIQLVHKGDLSDNSMQELIKVGRDTISIEMNDTNYELGYPQELWFVDAEKSVGPEFSPLFKRYSNKWIATLFNSFEEMIFLDVDAVLFVKPSSFFNKDGYRETDAFFFRDRLIDEHITRRELSYLKRLLPSKIEASIFDFDTGEAMMKHSDVFQSRYKHVAETGIFVLKRPNHIPGLLISTALNLWKETNEIFHGEKELFWLGQSIAGTDQYRFSKNPAGASGILTRNDKKKITYTCSAQPAHFDDNNKLLWLNGGARYCKWKSWASDFAKQKSLREAYSCAEDLIELYATPIKVNGAVIPARSDLSLLQKALGQKSGFQKCEALGCSGYQWCAYNRDDRATGKTLEFTQAEVSHFQFIVNVWNVD